MGGVGGHRVQLVGGVGGVGLDGGYGFWMEIASGKCKCARGGLIFGTVFRKRFLFNSLQCIIDTILYEVVQTVPNRDWR